MCKLILVLGLYVEMDGVEWEDLFGVWFDKMVSFLGFDRRCDSVNVFELDGFVWLYERREVFLKSKGIIIRFFFCDSLNEKCEGVSKGFWG